MTILHLVLHNAAAVALATHQHRAIWILFTSISLSFFISHSLSLSLCLSRSNSHTEPAKPYWLEHQYTDTESKIYILHRRPNEIGRLRHKKKATTLNGARTVLFIFIFQYLFRCFVFVWGLGVYVGLLWFEDYFVHSLTRQSAYVGHRPAL